MPRAAGAFGGGDHHARTLSHGVSALAPFRSPCIPLLAELRLSLRAGLGFPLRAVCPSPSPGLTVMNQEWPERGSFGGRYSSGTVRGFAIGGGPELARWCSTVGGGRPDGSCRG